MLSKSYNSAGGNLGYMVENQYQIDADSEPEKCKISPEVEQQEMMQINNKYTTDEDSKLFPIHESPETRQDITPFKEQSDEGQPSLAPGLP